MADRKVSELPAADALTGTEMIPGAQSGVTKKITVSDIVALGGDAVLSDTTGVTGADQITNMISLTQAEYDAITPSATTFYVITG